MRTRVKICGITRAEDGRAAADCGADAIGLVFHASSPRCVDIDQARDIVRALPPFVTRVGLFIDAPAQRVRTVLEAVELDLLQFHGAEPVDYCGGFGRPYIKAVRVRAGVDLRDAAAHYASAAGLLLDSHVDGEAGGTGVRFDWRSVPPDPGKPLIVAGGLDVSNVAEAIATLRPYAVDVSSGVERARGIKDAALIAAFIEEVNKQV